MCEFFLRFATKALRDYSIVEIRIVDILAVLIANHAFVVKKGLQALDLVVGIRVSTGGISGFQCRLEVAATFYRAVGEN